MLLARPPSEAEGTCAHCHRGRDVDFGSTFFASRERVWWSMGGTIVGSLLPVVITLLLGFIAARRHDFSQQQAAILNRLALSYALPLMLFVGTVRTSRTELRRAVPLLVALCVGIV